MFNNRFNNRNADPLVEAVKAAQADGDMRRQAIAHVNEAFGVYSRNAVVRENLAAYDAAIEEAYRCMKEGEKWEGSKKDREEDAKLAKKHGMTLAQWEKSEADKKHDAKEKMDEKKGCYEGNDGNLANNYPPYDKVTRGDVIAGRLGKDQMGGKKKVNEKKGCYEEVEDLDEISKGLAARYIKKTPESIGNARYASDEGYGKYEKWGERTMKNREKGISHAVDKITGSKNVKVHAKEEQIDELSRGTLNSYLKKTKNTEKELHSKGWNADSDKEADAAFNKRDMVSKARKGARERLKGVYHPKSVKYHAKEENDYSAPDRAAVTKDNKPVVSSTAPKADTSGPSSSDKAALTSKIKAMNEAVSRKHFQQVADLIKGHESQEKRNELASHHAGIFAKQNPRFDHARFHKAAGSTAHEAPKKMEEAKYSAKAARAGEDIGKPGKSFSMIAKKAGKRYGSEEKGKKVAGAILAKIRAKHMEEQVSLMPTAKSPVVKPSDIKAGETLGQAMNRLSGKTAIKGGANDPTSSNFRGTPKPADTSTPSAATSKPTTSAPAPAPKPAAATGSMQSTPGVGATAAKPAAGLTTKNTPSYNAAQNASEPDQNKELGKPAEKSQSNFLQSQGIGVKPAEKPDVMPKIDTGPKADSNPDQGHIKLTQTQPADISKKNSPSYKSAQDSLAESVVVVGSNKYRIV